MPTMNSPVSLIVFIRKKLLCLGISLSFSITLILAIVALFTLESIIHQDNINQLTRLQTQLNQLPAKQDLHLVNYNQLLHNPDQLQRSILVRNHQGQIVFQSDDAIATTKLERTVNRIFFSKPIFGYFHYGKHQGTIESTASSKNYLYYYKVIFSSIFFILIFTPILLFYFTHRTTRLLQNNIQPVIQTLHHFNQKDLRHQRAPYSHIQEIQIFNDAFNTLLAKLESFKQNLVEQNTHLNFQATHDNLTQLPNRQYFQEVLSRDFNQNQNSKLVVLFIDNNKFKEINDTFGHQAGDAVLIETSKRLKSSLGSEDFIARLGGDEFAAILRRVEHYNELVKICEKLVHSCDEPLISNEQTIPFSISVGASYAFHASSIEEFLHCADLAMYTAKNSEKKWHIYKREEAFSYTGEQFQAEQPKNLR